MLNPSSGSMTVDSASLTCSSVTATATTPFLDQKKIAARLREKPQSALWLLSAYTKRPEGSRAEGASAMGAGYSRSTSVRNSLQSATDRKSTRLNSSHVKIS